MKYENAKDILPPELIAQIQKYADGKLLYIPKKEETRVWGSVSGSKQRLLLRNQRIYNEYRNGKGIGALAEEYFLSTDSIKKIVYGKKQDLIIFEPNLDCAMKYHEAGLSEEWIRLFYEIKSGGEVYPEHWICDGLIRVPLRLIDMAEPEKMLSEAEINEPMLLKFTGGRFIYQGNIEFLNHLKENRKNSHPAFIFITDKTEYAFYVQQYGKQFHQAKI